MMHLLLPQYCANCGVPEHRPLQGDCVLCALDWPDLRGDVGRALVRGRVVTPWAAAGFRVPESERLRRRLYALKYGGEWGYGVQAGRWIAEGTVWPFSESGVALVPVPLHWRRRWKRGYNQTEALAKGLSEVWRCPTTRHVLRRVKHRNSLTQSGRAGRQAALQDTYRADIRSMGPSEAPFAFVLVDDVLTTGATCRAAASVLEAAGGVWKGVVVWGLA